MANSKKTHLARESEDSIIVPVKSPEGPVVTPVPDQLRINIAIGTLTVYATVLLLYILNQLILSGYDPDIRAILTKVFEITMREHESFFPEPVERLQFQLSLFCMPLFIFISYSVANSLRAFFNKNNNTPLYINLAGMSVLALYTYLIFSHKMVHFPGKDMGYFFVSNAAFSQNFFMVSIVYIAFVYGFFLYTGAAIKDKLNRVIGFVSYAIVAFILLDLILYNIFNLSMQERGRYMETNSVFYAVTQLYAGKSLLVNVNELYGFFPWVLSPLFKIIGLGAYKFGLVMGILNALSFLCFYLGIKKLLKNDILALLVFLAVTWWLYWATRLPFESTSRYYYQYYPVRILFPSITFFLLVLYQTCDQARKRIYLILIALVSALGVFWNMDSGVVSFGATLIALISSVFNPKAVKETIRPAARFVMQMFGALMLVFVVFILTAKMNTGLWPNLGEIGSFQNIYYISGYFMLPMSAIHFWNLPVVVYIATGVYCLYQLKKSPEWDTPVIVFLFILGAGIFSYFQGRSFDTNLDFVTYPAIILLGVFSNKLRPDFSFKKGGMQFHEGHVLFFIAFLFLVDSAFSLLYAAPDIHEFSMKNAFYIDPEKERALDTRLSFLKSNLHDRDTVIIIAQDYESYYYDAGKYYNPVPIPGSTEVFFKAETNKLLDYIKSGRYPVVYDRMHDLWLEKDTILKTLSAYTHIANALPDKSMLLLKPGKGESASRLKRDEHTAYYCHAAELNFPTALISLPDTFTIEFYARLDTNRLKKDNLIFANVSNSVPFSGFIMYQTGEALNDYQFAYGNGREWSQGVICKMSCTKENHIIIKVMKNIVTVTNNDQLCGQTDTHSSYVNSDKKFYINAFFAGDLKELKISGR